MLTNKIFSLLTACGASLLLYSQVTLGTDKSTVSADGSDSSMVVAANGTIYIPKLTLPPSRLWSPEFTKFFEKRAVPGVHPRHPVFKSPNTAAPVAEWEKYNSDVDRELAPYVSRVLSQYPVDISSATIGNIRVEVISPKDGVAPENRNRVLIELHGGLAAGLSAARLEAIPVASIGKIKVLAVDYHTFPTARYPAPIRDVVAVYRELLKKHEAAAIGIFGCSWGGKLTAQTVAWLQAEGLPRPGAVGIFCSAPPIAPLLDGKGGDSAEMWGYSTVPQPIEWYMEGVDALDPKAYPGSSDSVLAKFPPTLFFTGTRAFEMSSTVVAHARLLRLGVDSSLYVIEGTSHGMHLAATETPEVRDANNYIAHWFTRHLAQ